MSQTPQQSAQERLELEEAAVARVSRPDSRPHMPEPPPVRLVAVEDVHLQAPAGLEKQLDDFYLSMLDFEREPARQGVIHYKAENVRLIFTIKETLPPRSDLRTTTVEVDSLADAEAKIIAREFEYQRMKGLTAGEEALLLLDPAGNWLSIRESREVR